MDRNIQLFGDHFRGFLTVNGNNANITVSPIKPADEAPVAPVAAAPVPPAVATPNTLPVSISGGRRKRSPSPSVAFLNMLLVNKPLPIPPHYFSAKFNSELYVFIKGV